MLTLLTLQTVKVCQTFVSRQGNKLISSQKFNSIQSTLCTKCIAGNLASHLLIPFQTMADRNIDKYIYRYIYVYIRSMSLLTRYGVNLRMACP